GDIVLEQTTMSYDGAGNQIETQVFERNHDATGTGGLNGPNGAQPRARVSFRAAYFDAVGRIVADADFGTNGGATFSRPGSQTASCEECLVRLSLYNEHGELQEATDPAGTVLRTEF